ncbi:unnamed protein product [Paramecium octaurelia]|uniref:Uncharacterized protein n=1 Tax=Paramecium octaurelia TaxID=43137 RepID=A0A8S1W5F4_PAROT|nr:unnamed protein product [Paramecium octaurelia]
MLILDLPSLVVQEIPLKFQDIWKHLSHHFIYLDLHQKQNIIALYHMPSHKLT